MLSVYDSSLLTDYQIRMDGRQVSGAPASRTQSLRTGWQDTPWIQTGPRVNILTFSDFAGQAYSGTASTDVTFDTGGSWELTDDTFVSTETDLAGFGKWGAFDEANLSPSPEAFFLALKAHTALSNVLGAVDLTESGSKVVTYQALVKVTGRLKFSLARPDVTGPALATYDELVVGDGGSSVTDTVLVTLRMQLQAAEGSADLAVRITNNESSESAVQVYWQQAWFGRDGDSTYPLALGLANAGHVRTVDDPVGNTYNWAVNALGIKAASRFQLPLLDTSSGGDAEGMGWQSPVNADDYELVDGELYMDLPLKSVMGWTELQWYSFVQPDRVGALADNHTWIGGDVKNVLYTPGSAVTLNLSTSLTAVPAGSVVRVYNFSTTIGANVNVKVGGTTLSAVGPGNKMSEFLFYNDSGTGRWLIVQGNVTTGKLP